MSNINCTNNNFNYDETLIIFDWDDTILPLSWLKKNNLQLEYPDVIPQEFSSQLSILEKTILTLLERILVCGKVIIITNSEEGWVKRSCSKFLPGILPLLDKLKIISARSTFEYNEINKPEDWKIKAFTQEINLAFSDKDLEIRKNILSFGDAIYERIALFKSVIDLKNVFTKSIKLAENSTIDQLQRQLTLISNACFEICYKSESLDLMITIDIL